MVVQCTSASEHILDGSSVSISSILSQVGSAVLLLANTNSVSRKRLCHNFGEACMETQPILQALAPQTDTSPTP